MKLLGKITNLLCLVLICFVAFTLIKCFAAMAGVDAANLPDVLKQMESTYKVLTFAAVGAVILSVVSFKGVGMVLTVIRTAGLAGVFIYDLVALSDMKSDKFIQMALEGDDAKAKSMGIGLAVTLVVYVILIIISLVATFKKKKED